LRFSPDHDAAPQTSVLKSILCLTAIYRQVKNDFRKLSSIFELKDVL
jgi:hypothetical protein